MSTVHIETAFLCRAHACMADEGARRVRLPGGTEALLVDCPRGHKLRVRVRDLPLPKEENDKLVRGFGRGYEPGDLLILEIDGEFDASARLLRYGHPLPNGAAHGAREDSRRANRVGHSDLVDALRYATEVVGVDWAVGTRLPCQTCRTYTRADQLDKTQRCAHCRGGL